MRGRAAGHEVQHLEDDLLLSKFAVYIAVPTIGCCGQHFRDMTAHSRIGIGGLGAGMRTLGREWVVLFVLFVQCCDVVSCRLGPCAAEQMGGALARPGRALSLKASPRAAAAKKTAPMMSAGGFVPDMGRRQLMNAFLLGSVAGPLLVLPAVLISYLTPAKAGGGGGGTVAKDALGNDVKLADWLKANPAGSRKLVQGLKVSVRVVKSSSTVDLAAQKKPAVAGFQRGCESVRAEASVILNSGILVCVRVMPPTSSPRRTTPWRISASTLCALTLAAWCPGTSPLTSSAARATVPSTTRTARYGLCGMHMRISNAVCRPFLVRFGSSVLCLFRGARYPASPGRAGP